GTDPASIVRALPDDRAALAVVVPEGIALALSVPEEDPTSASRQIVDAVLTSIGTNGVVAAVSCPFSGAGGFSRAYHEARQVARCLRTFGAPDESRVLCGDELGAGSLFLASTTRADAEQFARHTLGPLFDPRDRSMRDLLATLAMFFASSRSVRETAEVIGVHENTIRYRLARIAELTGLDVATNVDHQLAGQLATLVL